MDKLEARIVKLETKIQSLFGWGKAILIVAVIFGLTGSWGVYLIKKGSNEISQFNRNIKEIKDGLDSYSDTKKQEIKIFSDNQKKSFNDIMKNKLSSCQALTAEDHSNYQSCPKDKYQVVQWCSGDCSGDDARVTICCPK